MGHEETTMGKVTTNWLTPGHSGSPCSHDDIYTKVNKKTGAVYSVKLCNPNDSCNELQSTGRNAFGVVSGAISAWINANKDPETADYKKVKAQYDRQQKYSSIRGLMMALGMYTVDRDGNVVVDVNARTNFKLVRGDIAGAAEPSTDSGTGGSSTTKYTLSLAASPTDGGTVSGGGQVNAGASVQISSTPASGYSFTRWSDGNTNASRSVTVNANTTLSAIFTANAGGGDVNPGGSEGGDDDEDGNIR